MLANVLVLSPNYGIVNIFFLVLMFYVTEIMQTAIFFETRLNDFINNTSNDTYYENCDLNINMIFNFQIANTNLIGVQL